MDVEGCLFIYGCGAFSRCGQWGLLFLTVRGLLVAVACQLWNTGSRGTGFSSCDAQTQLLRSMGDSPRPGIKPVSPALAGRFLASELPGESLFSFLSLLQNCYSPLQSLDQCFSTLDSHYISVDLQTISMPGPPCLGSLICSSWA